MTTQQPISVPQLDENGYNHFQEMREKQPVYRDPDQPVWSVFSYADVQRVLMDWSTFSSARGEVHDDPQNPVGASLISLDPLRHRQLRGLVTQAFTPRTIANLETRIEKVVDTLLDQVAGKESMDVIADLAFPLPVTIIAELLGVPSEDRRQFQRWSNDIVGSDEETYMSSQQAMGAYFFQQLAERRKKPQDDLLTALIGAEIDGAHLSSAELAGFCVLLLVAGHETTTNLLGNAFFCFDAYPDAVEELRADARLMPAAIEEILRFYSPVRMLPRVATHDTILNGQQIKCDDMVLPQFASANRDEAQFPQADVFDIHRNPNRHLAFGHGIHFCLGAPLARLEAKVALNTTLKRLVEIKRDRSVPLELRKSNIIFGVEHLPITFVTK